MSHYDGATVYIDGPIKQPYFAIMKGKPDGIRAVLGREDFRPSKKRGTKLLHIIMCYLCQSSSRNLGIGSFSARVTGG